MISLIFILLISIFIFVLSLTIIFRRKPSLLAPVNDLKIEPKRDIKIEPKKPLTISSQDINAISGGDAITTQLDLARAYMESGRKQLAKKMLEFVIAQGSYVQQEEAKHLLSYL